MDELQAFDLIVNYRNISAKLKKRFLRRPNIAEIIDELLTLANQCEDADMKPLAAFINLSAANCENTLGNTSNEIKHLKKAGQLFSYSQKKTKQLECVKLLDDDKQNAMASFQNAIEKSEPYGCLKTALLFQLAEELRSAEDFAETKRIYEEIISQSIDVNNHLIVYCHQNLAECEIMLGDYLRALDILTKLANILEKLGDNKNFYVDVQFDCEITRVFLLLILKPTSQTLTPSLLSILDKYNTEVEGNDFQFQDVGIDETLFILLQSLVLACQVGDRGTVVELRKDLSVYLNFKQKYLYGLLLNVIQ